MTTIIVAFYLLILLMYSLTSFFIIYHLMTYSINARLNKLVLPVFVFVSIGLLLSNVLLFFSIDWNSLVAFLTF